MSDEYIVCEHCGYKELKSRAELCECGSWYCRFSCLAKGLWKVGIMQYTFDEMDRCGSCAIEKLKQGKLTFPWGNKDFKRVLAPHLLIYVNELNPIEVESAVEIVIKTPIRRARKVSENQMSLF